MFFTVTLPVTLWFLDKGKANGPRGDKVLFVEAMQVLSERSDIIVITDEAHRSQYDQLAANMRRALPNAAFIGFTGTPLIAGQEERTREVFGDYVSVYNFAQSIADGATVPLYYEARKPELQLAADELKNELDALLDAAALNEEQEKKLQQTFGKQYHLITRNDRLDEIATDLVRHFSARGYLGKGMFVAIDKATAVRMHEKVRKAWKAELVLREQQLAKAPEEARSGILERLDWMRSADMAVVVSQSQNEIDDLKQKGLDILPHRERMQKEDLETKFKDPDDPLRLVFVCAMWITGFDVPTCSTIYLDNAWLPTLHIDVNADYSMFADAIRASRQTAATSLQALADRWAKQGPTFDDILQHGYGSASVQALTEASVKFQKAMMSDDPMALINAQSIIFDRFRALRRFFEKQGAPLEKSDAAVLSFWKWDGNCQMPTHRIMAYLFAALGWKISCGQRKPTTGGILNDFSAIATYGPYVDAMFVDRECAELLKHPRLRSDLELKAKTFSLQSRDEFIEYLTNLANGASDAVCAYSKELYGL
jgi:SWI2/SNF2 ATPase